MRDDPAREAKAWADRIAEADRQRAKAQDLAIEGLLSPDELRAKLADLGETRDTARRELAALEAQREQLAELESDRDIIIERYAEMVPENLDALTPEERHHLYKMLRLGVVSNVDRSLHVSGALAGTLEDEFRQFEAVSR